MNTRIMAVALVVVGLVGVRAAHAQEVELVRVIPHGTLDAGSWVQTDRTIIVIGQPNDATTVFPSQCGLAGVFEGFEVVVIHPGDTSHARPALRVTMHLV